jgi:hypothetical protein
MGRPIQNKYINPAPAGYTPGDGAKRGAGAGQGEGISVTSGNVVFASLTRGEGYFSNVAVTTSAPNLAGGVRPTYGQVHLFANGAIKTVAVVSPGSGYTAAPTLTFTEANTSTATATLTIDVATTTANSIRANCFFTGASSGVLTADILKARGARTFVVKNLAGTSETLKLVTNPTPSSNLNPYSEGTMTITATFADASTFNVAKITNRLVYSLDGNKYKWTLTTGAAANVSATDITVVVSSV